MRLTTYTMKTEIAYPNYPGQVSPQLSGLTYAQIEGVLADPRVIECLTSLLSEVLKYPLVPTSKVFNPDYYRAVTESLGHLGYVKVANALAASIITGRSVSELLWEDRNGLLLPAKFLPRPGDNLTYKWDNPQDGFYPVMFAMGKEYLVSKFPRQFIIAHYWAVSNADPYGNGLAEPLYQLVKARSRALVDWSKYSSTYAEPTRVGHYPADASDDDIAVFNTFINALGSARAVTLQEGFDVTYINPPATGNSQDVLYNTMSQDISLLILGEGTAGRQHVGGTATQDEVSNTLRGTRAYLLGSLISDTISKTISKWIGELNFPGEPPLELTYDAPEAPPEDTNDKPTDNEAPMGQNVESDARAKPPSKGGLVPTRGQKTPLSQGQVQKSKGR